MERDEPLPFPESWFQVAWSDELGVGAVRALRICGIDAVLFRGADGRARVLDAICPHLGAHLGYGGQVIGDGLRCPFHGWRYNGDGRCREIPYSDRIPAGARLRVWPVQEVNGQICVWYAKDGRSPDFRLSQIPALAEGRWTPPSHRTWSVRAPLQDIFENGIDVGHFWGIHGFERVDHFDYRPSGAQSLTVFENHTRVAGRVISTRTEALNDGAAYVVSHTRSTTRDILFVLAGVPLDADTVELRATLTTQGARTGFAEWMLSRIIARQSFAEVEKDVRVWNHKAHLPRPQLVPGDGPIRRYRRWFSQFYPQEAAPLRATVARGPSETAPRCTPPPSG